MPDLNKPDLKKYFSCEKKIRYTSKIKAENMIKAMKKRGQMCYGLQAYECNYCGGWHLGHKKNHILRFNKRIKK